MHKFLSMYLFLFITLYMFRVHRAHHQERQIVSIQPLVTVILCWWPRCVQVGRRLLPTCTHLLLLLRARQLKLRKHINLEAYCATLTFHQHRFSIPLSVIKRQRSLSEAVLISFGSTNGFPKMF